MSFTFAKLRFSQSKQSERKQFDGNSSHEHDEGVGVPGWQSSCSPFRPCREKIVRFYQMNAIFTSCWGLHRSVTNTFVMRRRGDLPILLITLPQKWLPCSVIPPERHGVIPKCIWWNSTLSQPGAFVCLLLYFPVSSWWNNEVDFKFYKLQIK